ncbi:MAG: thiamine phosphate synthase [Magnetococcales bacterium]|nr:thiamine phosphate synthase [Magnetococcales bacterium]
MAILSTEIDSSVAGIYPIFDADYLEQPGKFANWDEGRKKSVTKAIAAANISILQLRSKQSGQLAYNFMESWLPFFREYSPNTAIIINDRVDLALYFEADGVHMGQDDLPIQLCRRLLGKGRLIGLSTHNNTEIRHAADTSADYIGFGPVFPTTSKTDTQGVQGLDALAKANKISSLPMVAIGGIAIKDLSDVQKTQVAGAAMIGGLWGRDGENCFQKAVSCWSV